jgi:hypothetical protein
VPISLGLTSTKALRVLTPKSSLCLWCSELVMFAGSLVSSDFQTPGVVTHSLAKIALQFE